MYDGQPLAAAVQHDHRCAAGADAERSGRAALLAVVCERRRGGQLRGAARYELNRVEEGRGQKSRREKGEAAAAFDFWLLAFREDGKPGPAGLQAVQCISVEQAST